MFETMDINQLQEHYMELTGAERIACMRELARRFREGIGVDIDMEEAEAWEQEAGEAEARLRAADAPPQQPKQAPARSQSVPDMSGWDNNRVYQAYREGNLYAAAQFAVRLNKAGENGQAQAVCQELIGKLESDFSSDPTGQLLPQMKLLAGTLYEQKKQPDQARVCYEEAACELNYRPALLPLVNFYLKTGAGRYEKELRPLLAQLSNGPAEEKLAAAEGYQKLGSGFEASIHLENVLSDPQVTSAQRFRAMGLLRSTGHLKQAELDKKIAAGDPNAFLLLARERAEAGKLDEAENLLSRLSAAGIPLDGHQSQLRDQIAKLIAEERVKIREAQLQEERRKEQARIYQAAQEQQRIRAEQARREQEARQRQLRQQQEERLRQQRLQQEQERQRAEEERKRREEQEAQARRRRAMRVPLLFAALVLLGIAVALISNVVDLVTLKKIDVFEDIEVVVNGAAPYATVEILNNSSDPFVRSINFSVTPDSDLSSGDTVVITANVSKAQAKEYGYRVADSTMKYKLEEVPSYITDTSDLKQADVEALLAKAKEAISGSTFRYKELVLDSGGTVTIGDYLPANVDNIELLDVGYAGTDVFWGVTSYTIFTMKADLLDCEFTWYQNRYYENGLAMDFEDVYFYFVFENLKLDADGNLIQSGTFNIDMSNVFESRSAMEQAMKQSYSGLTAGSVACPNP